MATTFPLIEALNLARQYGYKQVVDRLKLSVEGGEVFGFLGPNGAGKTTSIKMIVGLLRPTGGIVKLAGYDVVRQAIVVRD